MLIADDDDTGRRAAAAAIRSLGVDVDIAVDGVEAVEAFRLQAYDVVLIDGFMPRMNGSEAVAAMRALALPGAKRVPILVLSSNPNETMQRQCLEAGADLVLHKGIGLAGVRAHVAGHLARAIGKTAMKSA